MLTLAHKMLVSSKLVTATLNMCVHLARQSDSNVKHFATQNEILLQPSNVNMQLAASPGKAAALEKHEHLDQLQWTDLQCPPCP